LLPQAIGGGQRLAVDCQQIVADGDIDPVLVGRTIFKDMRDFVATCFIVGCELDTQVQRLYARRGIGCIGALRGSTGARV